MWKSAANLEKYSQNLLNLVGENLLNSVGHKDLLLNPSDKKGF